MEIVVRQTEAHQHRRHTELSNEVSNDRDGPPAPDKNRLLPENLRHRLRRCPHKPIVCAHYDRFAGMDQPNFDRNTGWADLLNKVLVSRKGRLRLHPGYQAKADLCHRSCRNHRLCPCAGKSTGHPMHVHRRTRPKPLLYAEHRLARKFGGTDLLLTKLLLLKGERAPCLQLCLCGLFNFVIELRNRDPSIGPLQLGDHLRECHKGIWCGTAIHSRVKVRSRSAYLDFGVDHSAQTYAQRRQLRGKHLCITHQGAICSQLLAMSSHESGNSFASNLFLAFYEYSDI